MFGLHRKHLCSLAAPRQLGCKGVLTVPGWSFFSIYRACNFATKKSFFIDLINRQTAVPYQRSDLCAATVTLQKKTRPDEV
jgi:hypothetical protein